MRIVLLGAVPTGLGAALAARLQVHHIQDVDDVAADGFVLEGAPHDVVEAQALNKVLRRRASDVIAVLWVLGGPVSQQTEAILDHFRGLVVEVEPGEDAFDSALGRLREALFSR